MLPEIWIFDTYSILLLIGAIAAILIYRLYGKKIGLSDNYITTIEVLALVSILVGLGSAVLFQSIYDAFDHQGFHLEAMTFYGGLIGGAATFLLVYFFYVKKKFPDVKFSKSVLPIAPASITVAHGIGRIGCFCAGCCYGKETDSWLGMKFPDLPNPVYPTQLFEAAFLFILFAILLIIALKKQTKYTMCIYLLGYGIWRFLIEFIRGDERGFMLLNLAPSQWLSIVAVILSVVLFILFKKQDNKEKQEAN